MNLLKKEKFRYLRDNSKMITQVILSVFFIVLALWFFKHEVGEVRKVKETLVNADSRWVIGGLGLVLLYIFFQGLMYVSSFSSLGSQLKIWDGIILFLKRNFISVFLPAGGVSSLAFFNREIEKKGITRSQVYFASSIYGFVGILSVALLALPAFVIAFSTGNMGGSRWLVLAGVIFLLIFLYLIYYSLINNGILFTWLVKIFPSSEVFINDLKNNKINRSQFALTICYSIVIDLIGIIHIYISMAALHLTPSLFSAVFVYLVVVLFLIISPFLRGLGAIEISMTYFLVQSGFSNVDSISITILFRFFEFWLPLLAGISSFLRKMDKLIMRILPALLLLILGIVNIISVLTPALPERIRLLKEFIIPDVMTLSNTFVLVTGLFLLVTATFLLKGLRMAWWFAFMLSIGSFFGHIIKGIDIEEASVALLVLIILLATRREYYIKHVPKLRSIGIQAAFLSIGAVIVFGIVGFYFLDKRHFHIDFSFLQSIHYTLQNFFLVGSAELIPSDPLAGHFLSLIKISGFASMAFLIYSLVRPYVYTTEPSIEEITWAKFLTKEYGRSAVDYFKTYSDKMIFAPPEMNAFIAYRVSGNFAVALENPVAENEDEMKKCIMAFDSYCYENGLQDMYYRVPADNLAIYKELNKKSLFLGQEGIVDLTSFSLEGGARKSIRNALKKVTDLGYHSRIYAPPLLDGVLQKLRAVSDEWLRDTERSEIVFSQGMFVEREIKLQTVITLESSEDKIVAFSNIIPDYVIKEGTYDLVRKTSDAPNGTMDFILIEIFNYFKSIDIRFVNLGFAPMSGIDDPYTFPERSMKFAYEKFRSFSHFRGQREYKEKFSPVWFDKYLIYDHDFDLLQAPILLSKIIKP